MGRKPKIDPQGKPAEVIAIRFAKDMVEMLDLLTENRSEFIREATYEKIDREMKKNDK